MRRSAEAAGRKEEGDKSIAYAFLPPSLFPPKCRVYVSILPFDFLPDLMTAGSARKLDAV